MTNKKVNLKEVPKGIPVYSVGTRVMITGLVEYAGRQGKVVSISTDNCKYIGFPDYEILFDGQDTPTKIFGCYVNEI